MNVYFVVEGRRTEKKVYPKWFTHLIPKMEQVSNPYHVEQNHFYVFSGGGYPSLLHTHLRNSVLEVNEIGKFSYLVLCLDADEWSASERLEEIKAFWKKEAIKLNEKTTFVPIIQHRCIETWFLGNRKIFKRNPEGEKFREYLGFYDVSRNDPERMGAFSSFGTHAQFHASYLQEMLRERNLSYSKRNPQVVMESHYLESLMERAVDTGDIPSFQLFIEFCNQIRFQQ